MIAGANAVQVGTMNFVDPFIWTKLMDGIRAYMTTHHISRLQDIVGTVDTSAPENAPQAPKAPKAPKAEKTIS